MDGPSFEEFVASRWPALLRTATFLAGGLADGEDLLQSVLERCYRQWRRIDDPDRYVRKAMANAAAGQRRGRFREEPLGPAAERPYPDPAEPVAVRDQLLRSLRALTPRQRAVLVLRYFEDLSERETAAWLGCSVGSVKTHAFRGLERLRASGDLRPSPPPAAASLAQGGEAR